MKAVVSAFQTFILSLISIKNKMRGGVTAPGKPLPRKKIIPVHIIQEKNLM